jgi:hypothetical protein
MSGSRAEAVMLRWGANRTLTQAEVAKLPPAIVEFALLQMNAVI